MATTKEPPEYVRDDVLSTLDHLCGRLADAGHFEDCWFLRGVIDAAQNDTANPPGTSEDPIYHAGYQAYAKMPDPSVPDMPEGDDEGDL